jgi:hypothetical protein
VGVEVMNKFLVGICVALLFLSGIAPGEQIKNKEHYLTFKTLQTHDNLCRKEGVKVTSTAGPQLEGKQLFEEEGEVWTLLIPPQSITITWKQPVTFNTNFIRWSSADAYAQWYGLEYWDGEKYILVYEERSNNSQDSLRAFNHITTDRIRFTIFQHITGYQGVKIRYFGVYKVDDGEKTDSLKEIKIKNAD